VTQVIIGIVGQGFVGSAIKAGLEDFYPIKTYDIDSEKCNSTLEGLVKESTIIFQCLPTPMKQSGECDLSIVFESANNINNLCSGSEDKILIIKSTVPPGTTRIINEKCKNIDVIFSPEFLTEANSFGDFKNQSRIILGGFRPATTVVKMMFRKAFPQIPIVKTSAEIAETVKYFTNCFLASKVIFANEMYQICKSLSIDYDKVTEYALHDNRIGKSHLQVPGPDGDFGFGGHCFPKDLKSIIYEALKNGVEPTFLKEVNSKNNELRSDRDWERMKGRAVSEE